MDSLPTSSTPELRDKPLHNHMRGNPLTLLPSRQHQAYPGQETGFGVLMPPSRPDQRVEWPLDRWREVLFYLGTHPDTRDGLYAPSVLFSDLCRKLGQNPELVQLENQRRMYPDLNIAEAFDEVYGPDTGEETQEPVSDDDDEDEDDEGYTDQEELDLSDLV